MSFLFDEDHEVEMATCLHLLLLLLGSYYALLSFSERNPSVFEQRLNWEEHKGSRSHDRSFRRKLRMSVDSFEKLLEMIRKDLEVNEAMASLRGGPIIPEICLYVTLRWLAGGSYLDIKDQTGITTASFYRCLWKTIKAIACCSELAIKFPQTKAECEAAAAGFRSVSYNGVVANCIGVVDGYLFCINTPSKKEAENVRSYFSGHYQCYGLNIQAVTDHLCRFIYFAICAPGVTGDNQAIHQIDLFEMIENLPRGFCVIGDAAYQAMEHLVSIFGGFDRLIARNDNFNYYASQCRIHVEMAFGMMQMKWGILQHPAQSRLKNLKWQMMAIARLHNYVINERLGNDEGIDAPGQLSYLPTVPEDENGDPIWLDDEISQFPGWSELRESMVGRVEAHGLERPKNNRLPSL